MSYVDISQKVHRSIIILYQSIRIDTFDEDLHRRTGADAFVKKKPATSEFRGPGGGVYGFRVGPPGPSSCTHHI